jgi:hypothetical protein
MANRWRGGPRRSKNPVGGYTHWVCAERSKDRETESLGGPTEVQRPRFVALLVHPVLLSNRYIVGIFHGRNQGCPRYRVAKPAQIEYGGDKIACTVRDLSITGAALEVSDPTGIPSKFTLIVPEDGLRLPCRVVRRTDFRSGVAFD